MVWFCFALLFLEEVLLCLKFYVVLEKELFKELPSPITVDTWSDILTFMLPFLYLKRLESQLDDLKERREVEFTSLASGCHYC